MGYTQISQEKFRIIGCEKNFKNVILMNSLDYKRSSFIKFKSNKVSLISLILLISILIISFTSPIWSVYRYRALADDNKKNGYEVEARSELQTVKVIDLLKINDKEKNISPNFKYWFGTDHQGVDIFLNVFLRGRLSILLGLSVAIVSAFVGIIYGCIAGYFGGLIDDIMMRIVEIVSSIPMILWLIMIILILGTSFNSIVIGMSLVGWCSTALIIRGKIYEIKSQEYILAAKALGADYERVIIAHMLPNIIGIIIVAITNDIPKFIMDEAILSYIHLGIKVPYATLGNLLREYAVSGAITFYPYQILIPTVFLGITVLTFQLLGDGLRDALDPKII